MVPASGLRRKIGLGPEVTSCYASFSVHTGVFAQAGLGTSVHKDVTSFSVRTGVFALAVFGIVHLRVNRSTNIDWKNLRASPPADSSPRARATAVTGQRLDHTFRPIANRMRLKISLD